MQQNHDELVMKLQQLQQQQQHMILQQSNQQSPANFETSLQQPPLQQQSLLQLQQLQQQQILNQQQVNSQPRPMIHAQQPTSQYPLAQPHQQNQTQPSDAGKFQPPPFQPGNMAGLVPHRQPDINLAAGAWSSPAEQIDMQDMSLAELRSTIGQFGLPPNLKRQPLPSSLPSFQAQNQLPNATGPQPGMTQPQPAMQQQAPLLQQGPTYQQTQWQPRVSVAMPQYPESQEQQQQQQPVNPEAPSHSQPPVSQSNPAPAQYWESVAPHQSTASSSFGKSPGESTSSFVELPKVPRLSPPPLPTTTDGGFENLSVMMGVQESAESSGPRQAPESIGDEALLHEALADIMQLLIAEEHDKATSSTLEEPPSWACIKWASVTMHALAGKRQTMFNQGRRLLSHKTPADMSPVEEQLLTYIILDEPSWSSIFPGIKIHCKNAIASRMKPLHPGADSGGTKNARSMVSLHTSGPWSEGILPRQSNAINDIRSAWRTWDALPSPG